MKIGMEHTRHLYSIKYICTRMQQDIHCKVLWQRADEFLTCASTTNKVLYDIGVYMLPLVTTHYMALKELDSYSLFCEVFYTMSKLVNQIHIQLFKHKKEILEAYPFLGEVFLSCNALKSMLLDFSLALGEVYEKR